MRYEIVIGLAITGTLLGAVVLALLYIVLSEIVFSIQHRWANRRTRAIRKRLTILRMKREYRGGKK